MKLILRKLPSTLRGIYGPKHDHLAERQLYLHPEAADSILEMERDGLRLIFSDAYRSPEESLKARRAKPGLVKRPGESPHNFGLAIDLDTGAICKERGITKTKFDALMQSYDWFCHNKDPLIAREGWHYNYLGPKPELWLPACAASSSTSRAVEARVMALYGAEMVLKESEIRAYLVTLGHLPIGRELSEGIKEFQKLWDLDVDGKAGPKTMRTLASVCAEQEIV